MAGDEDPRGMLRKAFPDPIAVVFFVPDAYPYIEAAHLQPGGIVQKCIHHPLQV